MSKSLRFKFAKFMGRMALYGAKYGMGMGKSFPGWLFLHIGSEKALKELAKEPNLGSIIITGTNGKTTSTTILIKLLQNDVKIVESFESNTINALATGLLKGNSELGVFEYGIRDVVHGIPDTVQYLVDPIGVVYTNISREHAQVAGVKNPFKDYFYAKSLLSKNMSRGIIVTNADDPRTTYLGKIKEKENNNNLHVNYYGLDIDNENFINAKSIKCPICREELKFTKKYMGHRGIYHCNCGFKRPEPNIIIKNLKIEPDRWYAQIKGNLYNYNLNDYIQFDFPINLPAFGIYNLYNCLCAATAYASFTPKIDNIESTINEIFSLLDLSILPPGRFELVNVNEKLLGLGQGDNGDAVKANVQFMTPYIKGPVEFIYTTPDVDEEEVFEDHLESIRAINPDHLIIIPGRESVEIAKEYYNKIKDEFNADFYPLSYEKMNERIKKMAELVYTSKYDYIIMTGCGEEQGMWEKIKNICKKH